jgi:hypothetical protein
VEELAIGLILDDKIQGKIDQISGYLLLNTEKSVEFFIFFSLDKQFFFLISKNRSDDFFKYQAMARWAKQLSSLHTTVMHKLN